MKLAELTQFIDRVIKLDELTFTLVIASVIFARFLFKKIRGENKTQSNLQLHDSNKNIKFKGPAIIATLIILLNYFKKISDEKVSRLTGRPAGDHTPQAPL